MDTTVSILNCTFNNPILPASGPLVEGLENLLSLNALSLGGLVTKTISVKGAEVQKPCIVGSKHMLFNSELWSEFPLSYWTFALEKMAQAKTKPLGISVGYTVEELQKVVPALSAYADFFEVSTHYTKAGLDEVVKRVVSLTDKPVLIKLSPHVQEDLNFAQTILSHGAAGIVALNSFGPGLVLDLKSRGVLIGNDQGHAWVSGPAIKPFVLERISRLRAAFPEMIIVGCGGVDTAQDALEMVMAGADLVQVLSSALLYGRSHYTRIVEGLAPTMKANHIDSIAELRRQGFSRSRQFQSDGFPCVSTEHCTRCQKCVRVCPFEAYGVSSTTDHTIIPVLNRRKCRQCGLCESLCPVSAISGVLSNYEVQCGRWEDA